MSELVTALYEYIRDPENPEKNYTLGRIYEDMGQGASAVSFLLRAAERTPIKELSYECLIRMAMCFDKQGNRDNTVRGTYKRAIAFLPDRPEAYFYLSKYYERFEKYSDSYLCVDTALRYGKFDLPSLRNPLDYPGKYGLVFQKAVSAWWWGYTQESRTLFTELYHSKHGQLNDMYRTIVLNNMKHLGLNDEIAKAKFADFDWGDIERNEWFRNVVSDEVFTQDTYQKFVQVEENDVILDIGASVGPFTYSIQSKKPKAVYCFEPHPTLFKTLEKNLAKIDNVTCINAGIAETDGPISFWGMYDETVQEIWAKANDGIGIRFDTFIKKHKIDKIDFMKIDCEGGEYDVFNDENFDWILKNVKKISGEFHLSNPFLKDRFRKFRDKYLKAFTKFRVNSMDNVDIAWWLWEDGFIENYDAIEIHIDNTNRHWRVTPYPTMEFTTVVPVNGCVVDCAFCPQRTLEKSYTGERILSLDNFKRVVDKLPTEVRVTFAGFVEPWLNKNCTDMLLYAHEKGHPISVFTTGVGMTPDDVYRIKDIPFAGNPNGGFILHLPDAERIAKHPINKNLIRVYEAFYEVHHRIKHFGTMCMSDKVHESVSHLFPHAYVPDFWSRAGNLIGEGVLKPELDKLRDRYKSVHYADSERTCGCPEDLYHNVMLPNGDVSLCCMDYSLNTIIGNLFNQEYADVVPKQNTCYEICRLCENGIAPR